MTAKEAKDKANAFNSIKNDIIYKKIEKLIEQTASKGEYDAFIHFSDYEIEMSNNSSHYNVPKLRMKMIFEKFCSDGYNLEVKIYKHFGETQYQIKIDWSNENETGSLKYIRD